MTSPEPQTRLAAVAPPLAKSRFERQPRTRRAILRNARAKPGEFRFPLCPTSSAPSL